MREYVVITRVHTNRNWLMIGAYQWTKGDIEKWTYCAENNPYTQTSDVIIDNLAHAGNEVDWDTHEVIAVIDTNESNVSIDYDRYFPVREEVA